MDFYCAGKNIFAGCDAHWYLPPLSPHLILHLAFALPLLVVALAIYATPAPTANMSGRSMSRRHGERPDVSTRSLARTNPGNTPVEQGPGFACVLLLKGN